MNLETSFRLAWNILVHSKLRSWLTIIGIIVGVAAVVLIVSIGDGAKFSLQENLGRFGTSVITVSPGSDRAAVSQGGFAAGYLARDSARIAAKNLTSREVQLLLGTPGIKSAMGVLSDRLDVEFRGETASIGMQGIDARQWPNFLTNNLSGGRLLTQSDENAVVLGYRVANEIFKNKINVNDQLKINGESYRVVGIFTKSTGFGNQQDNAMFMITKAARKAMGTPQSNDFGSISVLPEDPNGIPAVQALMERRLMALRGETATKKTFTLISLQSAQEQIKQTIDGMTLFLTAIAVISLLVGAIGIANTMFTAVLEKTKEIGIMKAIGATDNGVLTVFLINSGLIGMVGGLIGIAIGVVVILGFNTLNIPFGPPGSGSTLKAILSVQLVLFMLLFSMGIGVASGLIPALRGARLRPAQALKYE